MERAGVEVKLNTKVTREFIQEHKPEAIILATGATCIIPDMPGVNSGNVITASDVALGFKKTGAKVVIIGSGMVGCEVAEYLAQENKQVTLLEESPRIGPNLGLTCRWVIIGSLREKGIEMRTKVKVTEITPEGVIVECDGASEFLGADSIVLAIGREANKELRQDLQGIVSELYQIGDCVEPRRIYQAIYEGFTVGVKI